MKRRSFLKSTLAAIAVTASSYGLAESRVAESKVDRNENIRLHYGLNPTGFKEGDVWATGYLDDPIMFMRDGEWVEVEVTLGEHVGIEL